MAPPRGRREEGVRREPEAPRRSRGRPLPSALARSVEPGAVAGDDERPRGPPPGGQDPEHRREQFRRAGSRRGAVSPRPGGHRLKPGALQHAPASDRGGSPPVLRARRDRNFGVESDRKRDPLRKVPRRQAAERPYPVRGGPVQTREPTSNGPPDPRAPEDRAGPSEDPRQGRARLASPPSAGHPDSRGEASVSIGRKRGGCGVVPDWPGNPNGGRDLEAPTARYVLSVRASSGAASPRTRPQRSRRR